MPPKNRFLIFALLWHIACWYGLLKESSGTPPPFPHFDKFAHCALFFAQIWLLARAWLAEQRQPPYLGLALFAFVFAGSSEIAQALFTQRTGDSMDMLADLVGAGLALLLAQKVYRSRQP